MTTQDSNSTAEDSFTLRERNSILDRFRQLERRQALLTATPSGTKIAVATSVRRIFPEREVVALESVGESANIKALLSADMVVFSGNLDGIEVRFQIRDVREATLEGRDLLAISIPEALFWLQRRNYFRVFIPFDMPMKCEVLLPNGQKQWFDVLNLSVRGLALLDKSGQLRYWGRAGQVFENCRLDLPGFETERLTLEIRGKVETSAEDSRLPTVRVGFAFRDAGSKLEAKIQRLINELELHVRRVRTHIGYSEL